MGLIKNWQRLPVWEIYSPSDPKKKKTCGLSRTPCLFYNNVFHKNAFFLFFTRSFNSFKAWTVFIYFLLLNPTTIIPIPTLDSVFFKCYFILFYFIFHGMNPMNLPSQSEFWIVARYQICNSFSILWWIDVTLSVGSVVTFGNDTMRKEKKK